MPSSNIKQYGVGTVSVQNGSTTVTGLGTLWNGQVQAGNQFSIVGEGLWYNIVNVSADGATLTLETSYLGQTATKAGYLVHRNFTPNNNYPIPAYGDQDTGTLLGLALTAIDAGLAQIAPKLTGIINGELLVQGVLTITGSSLAAQTLSSIDNFITVASGNTSAQAPTAGLKVKRGVADAFIAWNEPLSRWGAYLSSNGMTSSTLANLEAGTIYGTIASPSDLNLKAVIGGISSPLDRIRGINGVFFQWNEVAKARGIAIDGIDVGLIAQEVEKVLPEAVEGSRQMRYVHYAKLVPLLVEGVKALERQNASLRARIEKLEKMASHSDL